jgi:predicted PurR-regulated permease PerM/GAF domain-containing protein
MPARPTKTTATTALVGIWTILLTTFIVAALYFARDLLIPVALAALLTFLLSPLVTRLERWIGRVAAVLVVVALIFTGFGMAGWMLSRQLVDLAAKLPEYKGNIIAKLQAFQLPRGGTFEKLSQTVEELKQELPGAPDKISREPPREEGAPMATDPAPVQRSPAEDAQQRVGTSNDKSPLELFGDLVAPLLGPLGTAALVLLLLIFMLLQREDLRGRLIRLVGQGRISATTRAMDDAGARVSRYLLMQLVVNVTYGIPVSVGLYFLGVPNALLWGAFAVVLRFIPYVGPWIAAAFPITLALATSPGWVIPLLTIGLFVVLEILSNNVMEPWLYGSSTGVSPIALIIAAVFWTWMWGPVGLVLATPLTVCLVVMGRHVTRLQFLSVLLSDDEALTPAEDCYHRLLTPGEQDGMDLIESYLKSHTLVALYDSVLIPVLIAAEADARAELLDPEHLGNLEQSLRDIIEDLGTRPAVPSKDAVQKATAAADEAAAPPPVIAPGCRVICLPARAGRDEMAGGMLVQLLRQQGFVAQNAPAKLDFEELGGLVEKADVDVICISVVPPSTVIHARYLCLKLRALYPNQKIVVGLWGAVEGLAEAAKRLRESGADTVVTTLAEAIGQLAQLAPALTDAMTPAPIPPDEEERLAALAGLHLMDTGAEPVFDRHTAKLARVFEVPIVLITLIDRDREFIKAQTGLSDDLAGMRETPRDVSVSGHVVAKNQTMVIEDLARDRRFANNPLIKANGLRFYAGVPLPAPNGQPVGSLSLLDLKPRLFTERETRLLREYASEVTEEIGKRASPGVFGSVE